AAALRPRLTQALAGEQIATLQSRISRLERSNRGLRRDLEEAREGRGILSFLRVAADELGLGFGWIGLYFTAFTTLWRGQTPGKRLLGIRVLRLDGKPIGWWASFERFGGYAASILTGLRGFAQMLWDRNRQALHDKISETVVVQL
ncbi:MAG TPA: RDD family protein, partial [Longimicrobiaceae bacterium]|nr:RDD family protein [Longimicrobiaceae bacterium]